MKKALHMVLGVCLIIFALLRFNIGRVRFTDNTLNNVAIGKAHSYAFLIWGLTDLIVFGLLIQNTVSIGSQAVDGILKTLFKSSIPRIMILVINTFIIVILGQIIPYNPSGVSLNNLNNLAWAIKGTYPIILLFDMHTTKDMLMMKQSSLSGSTSQTYPTRTFNTNHKHSTVNVFGKSQA
ncbi:hypothetical protein BC833DRAFT_588386 [Globomyces pollinis-pini]|nr:hypothetical protein BC833DRAFT_588386 [Globomyces pollinis-pini]